MIQRFWLNFLNNTRVFKFTNIYKTADIGNNCVIGSYTEIGDKVKIGDNCKIQAKVFIPKGVTIGNNVFIGPCVKFTNDKYPKATGDWKVWETVVEDGASIGAGATIICGVTIRKNSMIGAGAVVTKDVPEGCMVVGVPAVQVDNNWGSL